MRLMMEQLLKRDEEPMVDNELSESNKNLSQTVSQMIEKTNDLEINLRNMKSYY